MEFRSVGGRLSMRTDGWTDRHDDANSCFLQFCESSKKQIPIHLSTFVVVQVLYIFVIIKISDTQ
jgi:hypothetical protein